LEKSLQIYAADGGPGGVKTMTHRDLLADLPDHTGRDGWPSISTEI
jgi:hypothetical protein